ncbi:hypothetical protein GGR58DRAFT_508919 [Xylaria digitata]|nr:hypothetical protein GGR58DRAFT_508919 [Xylaria digitata]
MSFTSLACIPTISLPQPLGVLRTSILFSLTSRGPPDSSSELSQNTPYSSEAQPINLASQRSKSHKRSWQDPRMSLRAICVPNSLSQLAPPLSPMVKKLTCLSSQDVDALLDNWARAGNLLTNHRNTNRDIFNALKTGSCWSNNVFGGLETSTRRSDGMCLWKWPLALFGTHPHDLFSWGLRYSPDDGEHQKILEGLCAILPHPVWENDISEPTICPPDGSMHSNGQPYTSIWAIAIDTWKRLRFYSKDAISRLVAKMQESPRFLGTPSFSMRDEERVFYLRAFDVTLLGAALDALHSDGDGDFAHSVFMYHHGFAYQTLDFWHDLQPTSREQMTEWDNICIENKYRDTRKDFLIFRIRSKLFIRSSRIGKAHTVIHEWN